MRYIEMETQNEIHDDPVYIITTILMWLFIITSNPWCLICLICIYKNNEDQRVQRNIKISTIVVIVYMIIFAILFTVSFILALIN